MFGDVFLLEREGAAPSRAERLAFGETNGRNEAWLRDTLFDHPDLLPLRDIDPSFGPLIPLCKELRTEAGPLDIAFINQHGRLTLVECKLWRNPEARRKVVAQVLDYARAISSWTYSDLQRRVSAALGRQGNVPFELARAKNPGLNEQQFVDDTALAMRSGRFLLLIAGDGIREDVSAITELVNRNAASGFAFGLVEVALYGFEDGGLAIQPRAIVKTQVIERTVVIVRETGQANPVPVVDEFEVEFAPVAATTAIERNQLGESPRQAAYREWWLPVLQMTFDDPDQEPPTLFWPNNIRLKLPWTKTWIAAYRYGGDTGTVAVGTGGHEPAYSEMMTCLAPHREEVLAEMPPNTEYRKFNTTEAFTFATSRSALSFANDDEKRTWLSMTINAYVNALRPMLKTLIHARRTDTS
jgi:hypothetical protein